MAGETRVSVVMPARNAACTVEDQLSALSRQSYQGPFEVVVVDDGSSDDTARRVLEWSDRVAGLRLIDGPGAAGSYSARNLGTARANGRFVLYCDADDVVSSGWVEHMVEALAHHGLVTGPLDASKLNPPEVYSWRLHGSLVSASVRYGFLPAAPTCNLGVRREVFTELGGFDAELASGGDFDLCWRAQLRGHSLHLAPGAIVHRRAQRTATRAFARHASYGRWTPLLYRRFRDDGMPQFLARDALFDWWTVLVGVPFLLDPHRRYEWAELAGRCAGRLMGSVRWRTLYL